MNAGPLALGSFPRVHHTCKPAIDAQNIISA